MSMKSTLRRIARRLVGPTTPPAAGPAALRPVWERIEAMDYGIHVELVALRAEQHRGLDRVRREVDALRRRIDELEDELAQVRRVAARNEASESSAS